MSFWRRLKNLWRLSAYAPNHFSPVYTGNPEETRAYLKKEFPTIQKKLATIVRDEEEDF